MFEPLDYGTAQAIEKSVRNSIDRFEPRIAVLNLECIPNYDDNGFDVEMTYEIRGSNNPPTAVEFFLARTR